MAKIILSEREKRKRFEATDVFKRNELKRIRSTGYEAFRVSPRLTTKYGKSFRKIYGAVVEPDFQRGIGKKNKYGKSTKFESRVKWFPHGYTSAKVKSGTRLLATLGSYPVDQKQVRSALMLKTRKKKK